MVEAVQYLIRLVGRFRGLKLLLENILRDEHIIEDHFLVKHGFLIKRYSLRWGSLTIKTLEKLKEELGKSEWIEEDLKINVERVNNLFGSLERDYNASYHAKLRIKSLIIMHINHAIELSRLSLRRIDTLISLKELGVNLHPQQRGEEARKAMSYLEKNASSLLRIISFLEQLSDKIKKFNENNYYPMPRTYGRLMSIREYRNMKKTNRLSSRQDPTPVFDSPNKLRARLLAMSSDDRRMFFRAIGVRSQHKLVFFKTRLKPVVGPVPQSNGLIEFKLPKGIDIEILQAA